MSKKVNEAIEYHSKNMQIRKDIYSILTKSGDKHVLALDISRYILEREEEILKNTLTTLKKINHMHTKRGA